MKVSSFIVAAIATLALGMGSARAEGPDSWHMNYTLTTNSQTVAPYTSANARMQPQAAGAIATASNDPVYRMTYGQG